MVEFINLEKIKEYILKNNISETQFAKIIGVNYTPVYRVLRNQRKPGMKFILGVLKNTDLKYDEIFLNTTKSFQKNTSNYK